MNRGKLMAAAKDMNTTLGLDPEIDTSKKVSDENLLESIKSNADEITEEEFDAKELDSGDGENLKKMTWSVLKELKELPQEEEELKAEPKAEKEGKESKPEKPKKKNGKKAAKPAKTPEATHYCRESSICDAVAKMPKEGSSEEELAAAANTIYVKHGGKDNQKQSLHVLKVGLKYLMHMKLVISKGNKIICL